MGVKIDDIGKLSACVVGLSALVYIAHTIGYLKVVGFKISGMFFDATLLAGVLYVTPYVIGTISISFWVSGLVYGYLTKRKSDQQIIDLIIFFDRLLIVPIVATFFLPNWLIDLSYVIYVITILVMILSIIFRLKQYGSTGYFSISILIIACYNVVEMSGKSDAYRDLNDNKSRYGIYTTDKNYVNANLMRSTTNGILIKSGNEIIFYPKDAITKISKELPIQ